MDDVLTALDILKAGEIEFLLIDSLTKVWYRYVREYLEKNRRQFMELQDWGKLLPKWQETFSDAFVSAHGSIVFTGRGGFTYEKEEDTRDDSGRVKKGQFVKSGVKMKLAGETPFEPDLNVWMEQQQEIGSDGKLKVWRDAQVMKDRSGLIDGQVFSNPAYAQFAPFVRYLVDVPEGVVAGESSSRNLAPGENFESFHRKEKKEIALEEMAEELNVMFPGSTDAAKTSRKDELQRVFGTRSWKAVEAKPFNEIIEGRDKVWIKSRGHAYGAGPPANAEQIDEGDKIPHEPKQDAA